MFNTTLRLELVIISLLSGSAEQTAALSPFQRDICNEMAAAGMSTATIASYLITFLPEGYSRTELQHQVNEKLKLDASIGQDNWEDASSQETDWGSPIGKEVW